MRNLPHGGAVIIDGLHSPDGSDLFSAVSAERRVRADGFSAVRAGLGQLASALLAEVEFRVVFRAAFGAAERGFFGRLLGQGRGVDGRIFALPYGLCGNRGQIFARSCDLYGGCGQFFAESEGEQACADGEHGKPRDEQPEESGQFAAAERGEKARRTDDRAGKSACREYKPEDFQPQLCTICFFIAFRHSSPPRSVALLWHERRKKSSDYGYFSGSVVSVRKNAALCRTAGCSGASSAARRWQSSARAFSPSAQWLHTSPRRG